MKQMYIAIAIAFTIAIGLLVLYSNLQVDTSPNDEQGEPITATFLNENAVSITVVFEDNTATLNGVGYQDISFTQTVSASGARYENTDIGLILWNKGDTITLTDTTDAVLFEGVTNPVSTNEQGTNQVVAPSDSSLSGTSWAWVETQLMDSTVVSAPDGQQFVLTFNSDNTVDSSTDCNSLGGSYVQEEEVLSFGDFMSTRMYCENSLEGTYSQHLGLTNSFTRGDNMLRLNLNRDYGIMIFSKVE